MNSNEYEICCPIDEKVHRKWIEKLHQEKNALSENIKTEETVLKIIGNPSRLAIMHFLSIRPHCVCEIVQKLDVPHSNVSYHISQLIFADILENVSNNGRVYYSLTNFGKNIIQWLEKIPVIK